MTLTMSKEQREAYLAGLHVAVISVPEDGRGPLTVPIWYDYEPGGVVRCVTGSDSRKAALIRRAGRLSLCVQTETPPYQYVSVEGPVTIATPEYERDIRQMAYRYLGEQLGDWYLQANAERIRADNMLVVLTPERWFSVDYGKMTR